jgi:hypothetical protein
MSGFVITEDTMKPPEGYGTGLIERKYDQCPVGYNSKPFSLPILSKTKQAELLAEIKARKGSLRDIRRRYLGGNPIPSTNQEQTNYCWSYSSTSAVMLKRAYQGEPHTQLSGAANAAKIKNFKNVGGWGSQSLERSAEFGIPDVNHWAEGNAGLNRHWDSEETWKNASKNRVQEWMDLEPRNVDQMITCVLLGIPVVSDFNWWGHSVCTMEILELNPLKTRIWNSWGDKWGDLGEGILEGNKAIPDGAIAPFSIIAS